MIRPPPEGVDALPSTPSEAAHPVRTSVDRRAHQNPRVGLEPSGGVGDSAAAMLVSEGLEVALVAPRSSSKRARSRQHGKTDPIDAIATGRILLQEPKLPPFQPGDHERDLELLVDYRDQLQHECTP